MDRVSHCICCGSPDVETFPAYLSAFVVDRMLGTGENYDKLAYCQYLHCKKCDYVGTDIRFSRNEEIAYYQNYMKEEYCRHRAKYENDGAYESLMYYSSPEYQTLRKNAAGKFLSEKLDLSTITSVLDFGGDTGAMIPDELQHAARYVTDIQERELVAGVKTVNSPDECGPVDLLICGHTLEHVSEPGPFMFQIRSYMKPGSLIYMEIPIESCRNHVENHLFHEHINRFDLGSLTTFMLAQGFDIIGSNEFVYNEKQLQTAACAIIGRLK
jgi:2-polyprenyl-3-methyl-5-hydroxy-6-metoxy-1,4-benzoquinol methylase